MQQTNLERILKNGKHLLGLVNDVLDLEKMEAGRMDIAFMLVDVKDLLTSVVDEMQSIAIARNLVLHAEIDEQADFLESDLVKLRQVLLNLVSSALKFTEQGEVTVSARRLTADEGIDSPVFEVRDSGIGIAPDMQARIFEAFFQVDTGYTHKLTGTGLGLTIVSRLTALLGDKIEVRSAPGQGSTCTVILPITVTYHQEKQDTPRLHPARQEPVFTSLLMSHEFVQGGPGEPVAGSSQQALPDGQRDLVLAVDDNPDVIVLLKNAFQDTPYGVVGVQDPTHPMDSAVNYTVSISRGRNVHSHPSLSSLVQPAV